MGELSRRGAKKHYRVKWALETEASHDSHRPELQKLRDHENKVEERHANHLLEMQKLWDHVDKLENIFEEYSRRQDRKVKESFDQNERSRDQLKVMELAFSNKEENIKKKYQIVVTEQQKTIDENNKLIRYLKRENTRARTENLKVQSKLDEAKLKSFKIQDTHVTLVHALDEANKALTIGPKIQSSIKAEKAKSKSLNCEVSKMQAIYMKEAKSRLRLQKSLANIITSIRERVQNRTVVEESVIMALQAETVSKSIMAALDVYSLEPDLTSSDASESEGSDFLTW